MTSTSEAIAGDQPASAVSAPSVDAAGGATWRSRAASFAPEAAVVAVAFVINAWSLSQNGYGNSYYSATVRSMGESVHNFVYGVYDPGSWITTDKPPFPYWIGTIVTKIFGYSSWTLLLPSAICGAAAVAFLVATIRPVWGRGAGIVAGAVLAITPAMVAVSRSNNPDAMLVLLTVMATWATALALRNGRTRWILIAAGLVGLAFLTKLLAGFVALPGLWLAYLIAGPTSWKRRTVQLAAGTGVIAVVAGGWVAFMDLTRTGDLLPYVGSSTDGSARDLVLGYNGFGRIFGQSAAGGQGGFQFGPGMMVGGNGIDQFGGAPGATRLFNNGMGDQIMWLLPIAVVAGLAVIAVAVRGRGRGARLGTVIAYLSWLLVTAAVFSTAKGIFHNYYVSLLAPAVAALVGIGFPLVRHAGKLGRVVAALTLAATVALQLVLLDRVEAWQWLRIVVPIGLGLSALALLISALPVLRNRAGTIAVAATCGALVVACAAPTAWSLSAWQRAANGTFPDARPVDAGGIGFGGGGDPFGGALPESELNWLRQQRTTERWILAVGSSLEASTAISRGDSIMAMGGFTGSDPAMTKERLADLVDNGELRFINAGGMGGFGGGSNVTGMVTQVCTAVPATNWGGTGDAMSSIYDCKGKGTDLRNAQDMATPNQPPFPGGAPPAGGGQFPGGGQLPEGGFPGGEMPGGISSEQIEFAQCVTQNGGNIQDLMSLMGGSQPSSELQAIIDRCGGLPIGTPAVPANTQP